MSSAYVSTLGLVVVALLAARLVLPALPLRASVGLTRAETAALVAGVVLLVFHCTAMFFPRTARHIPGTDTIAHDIRALGATSEIWYVVPALVVMVALHGLPRLASLALVAVLVAVGVTMYDDGPLHTHLAAIAVAVVTLAACLATLVRVPRPGR